MVCVVPTASVDRVEFMTVEGDSVVGRAMVDASGTRLPVSRPGCTGWERGRWSADGRRLLMNAEYRCGDAPVQRSDAIIAPTHFDAFTHIERTTSGDRGVALRVHFIVQLDTTTFPREVRQRMTHLRPLSVELETLEAPVLASPSAIVEAAAALDGEVVEAWLDETGQRNADMASAVRILHVAARGGELPRAAGAPGRHVEAQMTRFGTVYGYTLRHPIYLTADHGIIPLFLLPGISGLTGYSGLLAGGGRLPFAW